MGLAHFNNQAKGLKMNDNLKKTREEGWEKNLTGTFLELLPFVHDEDIEQAKSIFPPAAARERTCGEAPRASMAIIAAALSYVILKTEEAKNKGKLDLKSLLICMEINQGVLNAAIQMATFLAKDKKLYNHQIEIRQGGLLVDLGEMISLTGGLSSLF